MSVLLSEEAVRDKTRSSALACDANAGEVERLVRSFDLKRFKYADVETCSSGSGG